MKKISTNNSGLKNLSRLLYYVWKFAPELIGFRMILLFFSVATNIMVHVSMIKIVVDGISAQRPFFDVAIYILISGLVVLVSGILDNVFKNYLNTIGKLKIHKGVHTIIFNKVHQIDLENYDNANFYDDYIWALEKSDTEIINSYENIYKLILRIVNASVLLSITLIYDRLLLLFVIIPVVIILFAGGYLSRLQYEYEQEVNVIQRRKNYARRVFYLKEYAKELKMYSIGQVLLNCFRNSVDENEKVYKRFAFRFVTLGVVTESATSIFGLILLCLYMAFRAIVQGVYTAGTAAAMLNAVNNLAGSVSEIFALIPKLKRNSIFAEKIFKVIDYESRIEGFISEKPVDAVFERISLKNVSFSYPGSTVKTINDVSLSLRKGEKIAIVGINGAGKTTLIKLIMRYYDPQTGSINYNGTDIKELTTKNYRQHFASIFQDFQIYAVSLAENVAMNFVEDNHEESIRKALENSQLGQLKNDLNINMTKEFDQKGMNLSGGQRQKIAIARALYRDSDIIIMDEASSALDPISEVEINKTIIEQLHDKSMIIISHRLSTIKHVDKIYFMENGEIVESGSHEELMNLNGKYAKMFMIQAEQYHIEEAS